MKQALRSPQAKTMTVKAHELFKCMVDNDLTVSQAGEILDISATASHSRAKTAIRAEGIPAILAQYPGLAGKLRGTEPNKLSTAFIEANEADKMRRRDVAQINPGQELDALQNKLRQTLSYLDATTLSTAKASELTSVIKTLFDVSQTIQGKPSSITASQNVKALDDLLPQVMREAARRGIVIEGEVVKDAIVVPSAKTLSDSAAQVLDPPVEGHVAHPPGGQGAGGVPASESEEFFDPFKL